MVVQGSAETHTLIDQREGRRDKERKNEKGSRGLKMADQDGRSKQAQTGRCNSSSSGSVVAAAAAASCGNRSSRERARHGGRKGGR
jgi:hypothetical protein